MAGLVPAIHGFPAAQENVDARAFASPKRLRPRRRDKPGMTDACEGPNAIAIKPHHR